MNKIQDLKNIFIGLIIITLTSCSFGKNRVFYEEMSSKPLIKIYQNKIELVTENSKINSALSIYKINYSIDTLAKKVFITGFQSINKKSQNAFQILVEGFTKTEISNYKFFWVDSNKNQTEIDKEFSF